MGCCQACQPFILALLTPPPAANTSVEPGHTVTVEESTPAEEHGLVAPTPLPGIPPGAVQVRCQHVYDGDTLTLVDQTRVRLLGIDAPEIKQKQPFAEDSRNFVRGLCAGKDLWLEYGKEPEDRFQRKLAYVYAKNAQGQICLVNEQVLLNGFGKFYCPGETLSYADRLQQAQSRAKGQRLGVWTNFDGTKQVQTTHYGKAYHASGCKFLANSHNIHTISESAAIDKGLSACRECSP